MPGGKGGYPAFWIRDFAMSLESGFVSPQEMLDHLRLMARCQNGPQARQLQHGLVLPPFAVPDHINFDGTAVFYPGTYQNGAYWHTPTGWVISVLQRRDPALAMKVFQDYIHHLRANDFRLGQKAEAPWECFGPKDYVQNGVYMTSVTLPWAVLKPAD